MTIDNPPANALTSELIDSLATSLRELGSWSDAPGVVLTGAGNRFFCPGGDIKELNGAPVDFAVERMRLFHEMVVALERFPRPLVCAVGGYCVGGGFELALFADAVIASPEAQFGFPEINHGLLPAVKGMRECVRRLGPNTARRLLYSGELIKCEEAAELGIVDEIVPTEQLLQAATDHAGGMAAKPRPLFTSIKRAIQLTADWDDDALEQATLADMMTYFGRDDTREARARWSSADKARTT